MMRCLLLVLAFMLVAQTARADDLLFRWLQPSSEQTPAADVTWAILFTGTSMFDPEADDSVNGDVAAVAVEVPEALNGVHSVTVLLARPVPQVTLYQTVKSSVGQDGRLSLQSNTIEQPVPEAPVLLGNGAALLALFGIRRRA
jgi:hypothetical protein